MESLMSSGTLPWMDNSEGTSWTELSISFTIRGLIAFNANTYAGPQGEGRGSYMHQH